MPRPRGNSNISSKKKTGDLVDEFLAEIERPKDLPRLSRRDAPIEIDDADIRDLSRVTLDSAVFVQEHVRRLVASPVSPRKMKLAGIHPNAKDSIAGSFFQRVVARIDIAVIRTLLDEGLLRSFLTVEGGELDWMFDEKEANDRKKLEYRSGKWLLECIDGDRVQLFMTTYTLWRRIANHESNENLTRALSRCLSYAAYSMGFYHEAISICSYMLGLLESKDISRAEHVGGRARWWIIQGASYGCLGDSLAADRCFASAHGFVSRQMERVAEANRPAYQAQADLVSLHSEREALRNIARRILGQVPRGGLFGEGVDREALAKAKRLIESELQDSRLAALIEFLLNEEAPGFELPKWRDPAHVERLERFIEMLKKSPLKWPIDYDTAARCTVLFGGSNSEARELLREGRERFDALSSRADPEDETLFDAHVARYVNRQELDCLATTSILIDIDSGDDFAAREQFNAYCKSLPPALRRHSLHMTERMGLMLYGLEWPVKREQFSAG